MIALSEHTRVYLAVGATDMRKQIDGLAVLVEDVLEQDPFANSLFVFCNRRRDCVGLDIHRGLIYVAISPVSLLQFQVKSTAT